MWILTVACNYLLIIILSSSLYGNASTEFFILRNVATKNLFDLALLRNYCSVIVRQNEIQMLNEGAHIVQKFTAQLKTFLKCESLSLYIQTTLHS